jgi:hypothetical protein
MNRVVGSHIKIVLALLLKSLASISFLCSGGWFRINMKYFLFVPLLIFCQMGYRQANQSKKSIPPVVCKLSSPELKARKATVIASLKAKMIEKKELVNGAMITDRLGRSMDAGNLGRDFAMLAIIVFAAMLLQLGFLHPKGNETKNEGRSYDK